MASLIFRRLSAVLLTLTWPWVAAFAASDTTEPIRILFIGNSYTCVNDLPRIVQLLAIQSGQRRLPEVRMVSGPGFTFEDHWKLGSAMKALESNRRNYVVLQEQSQQPTRDQQRMQDFGTRLIRAARQRGAQALLFVTWPQSARPAPVSCASGGQCRRPPVSGMQIQPSGRENSIRLCSQRSCRTQPHAAQIQNRRRDRSGSRPGMRCTSVLLGTRECDFTARGPLLP